MNKGCLLQRMSVTIGTMRPAFLPTISEVTEEHPNNVNPIPRRHRPARGPNSTTTLYAIAIKLVERRTEATENRSSIRLNRHCRLNITTSLDLRRLIASDIRLPQPQLPLSTGKLLSNIARSGPKAAMQVSM